MGLRHFAVSEFHGAYSQLDALLLAELDELRDQIGAPIVIHPGELDDREGRPDSLHPRGYAVDCHAVGISLGDFWLQAERRAAFKGIGIYPFWESPGLHLDTRRTPMRARWYRDASGLYWGMTWAEVRALADILGPPIVSPSHTWGPA